MELLYNKIFFNYKIGALKKDRFCYFRNLKDNNIIKNGKKYLNLVHSSEYIERIKSLSKESRYLDFDTKLDKESYKIACYAVGLSIEASEKCGFALIQPPGHHASTKRGGGFCLFNNIAIASKKLVEEGKKIAILDFDGHFGDGTAEIFYQSNDVLYISIHQYPAYPGKGWVTDIGSKEGEGYTINIPLPPGSGDDLFNYSIKKILSIIKQFKPDVIGVSAGFDGHREDPLLELNFSLNSFYYIGKTLSKNFKNIFAVLEGGYDPEILFKGVVNFINGINKKEIKFRENPTMSSIKVKKEYKKRITLLKENLSSFWKI